VNDSVIAAAIREIRGNMTDQEFADALDAFSEGELQLSSNTIQKYRTAQRDPSYENLQTILAYGTKADRISSDTADKIIEFFHLGELMSQYTKLSYSDAQFVAEQPHLYSANVVKKHKEIPILQELPHENLQDDILDFITFPSSLLSGEDYFFIKGDRVEGLNIEGDDLVLVRRTSIAENNHTVIAWVNGGVICKKFFRTDDNNVIFLPSIELTSPVPLGEVKIIGVVEKVIKNI
jgi:SOS-response transcriptional repressor LexA